LLGFAAQDTLYINEQRNGFLFDGAWGLYLFDIAMLGVLFSRTTSDECPADNGRRYFLQFSFFCFLPYFNGVDAIRQPWTTCFFQMDAAIVLVAFSRLGPTLCFFLN
jgi:hypothetical protein